MGEMADDARAEHYVKMATEEALEKARPRSLRAPKYKDPRVWERANGSIVHLDDMTDDHLEAALHMMLGFRLAERRYVKNMNLSFYSKDQVLDYKINQLVGEWNRRMKPESLVKRLVKKIFK